MVQVKVEYIVSGGYRSVRVVNGAPPLTVQEGVLNFCFVDDLARSQKLDERRRIRWRY